MVAAARSVSASLVLCSRLWFARCPRVRNCYGGSTAQGVGRAGSSLGILRRSFLHTAQYMVSVRDPFSTLLGSDDERIVTSCVANALPLWRTIHRNIVNGAHEEFGGNGDCEMHHSDGVPLRRPTNSVVPLHDDSAVPLGYVLLALALDCGIDALPFVLDAGPRGDMATFLLNKRGILIRLGLGTIVGSISFVLGPVDEWISLWWPTVRYHGVGGSGWANVGSICNTSNWG